jgi:uncharacterized protein (TIGR02118 family)
MIKVIAGAIKHPTNRTLEEFQHYWAEKHGPMFSKTPHLRRYVQHITLLEAYDGPQSKPTHDGASMFWYDDLDTLLHPPASPKLSAVIKPEDGDIYDWYVASKRYGDPDQITIQDNTRDDDRQLFDRSSDWPLDHRRVSCIAAEHVIVDGPTNPSMVKVLWSALRRPGLSQQDLFSHWLEVHGPLAAKAKGMRRYVQNHAVPGSSELRGGPTHDGFSEAWFDDLPSFYATIASPEWEALREDGARLFAQPLSIVIARERVQKG